MGGGNNLGHRVGGDLFLAKGTEDEISASQLKADSIKLAGIEEGATVGGGTQTKKVVGTTSVSTSSSEYVDMPNMSIIMTTGNNPVLLMFNAGVKVSYIDYIASFRLLVDEDVKTFCESSNISGGHYPMSLLALETLTAGEHTIKIQWKVSNGSVYNWAALYDVRRTLIAIELKT